jgi:dipeptidase D
MDPNLQGLEPAVLWRHFDQLRQIPRCSKHEERARAYILQVADDLGLESVMDDAGNVVVRKAASPGGADAPIVVLQGHLDMVCEKNADVVFDFDNDPLHLDLKGDLLYAQGTTLGADNGIGIATALAALESRDITHGPIEALFTVDEETGLTGAFALGGDMLKGRLLLNLDSEDMGVITIGCAGGGGTNIELPLVMAPVPDGWAKATVRVEGLRGGHSGIDIHEYRANAVKLLSRVIWYSMKVADLRLISFQGGDKHNALPREASAEVVLPQSEVPRLRQLSDELRSHFLEEFGSFDKDIEVNVEEGGQADGMAASPESTDNAVDLLMALPHGVEKFSHDVEGLVETSTNLASVKTEEATLRLHMSSRSAIRPALDALRGRIEAMASLAGGEVEQEEPYPGWKPNPASKLLATMKEVHAEVFGEEPEVEAIHAGVEAGIIGEKFPGVDMVSIGPTIKNPHSPEEYVDVKTVEAFWRWIVAILEHLAS